MKVHITIDSDIPPLTIHKTIECVNILPRAVGENVGNAVFEELDKKFAEISPNYISEFNGEAVINNGGEE